MDPFSIFYIWTGLNTEMYENTNIQQQTYIFFITTCTQTFILLNPEIKTFF